MAKPEENWWTGEEEIDGGYGYGNSTCRNGWGICEAWNTGSWVLLT